MVGLRQDLAVLNLAALLACHWLATADLQMRKRGPMRLSLDVVT